MKTCPECNEKIEDNASVCIYCGWDFSAEKIRPWHKDYELRKLNNRYEYKVVKVYSVVGAECDEDAIESELNNLAKKGWRLHTIYTDTSKAIKGYGFEEDTVAIREEYETNRKTILVFERLLRLGSFRNEQQ